MLAFVKAYDIAWDNDSRAYRLREDNMSECSCPSDDWVSQSCRRHRHWIHVDQVVASIATVLGNDGVQGIHQVMKLSEEVGEATQAYMGWQGINPRKGVTHTQAEFLAEVADVALTAMTTLAFFGEEPMQAIRDRIDVARNRIIDRTVDEYKCERDLT